MTGADPWHMPDDLVHALKTGDMQKVHAFVAQTPEDINARDKFGNFPLLVAARSGQKEAVEFLLNNFASCVTEVFAAIGGFDHLQDVSAFLLERGAMIDWQSPRNGHTALMNAALMGNMNAAIFLIERNCDTTLKNHDGKTAADIAESRRHAELAEVIRGGKEFLSTCAARRAEAQERLRVKIQTEKQLRQTRSVVVKPVFKRRVP